MAIQSLNPATGEIITTFPEESALEVQKKIVTTHAAYENWRKKSFEERKRLMKNAASVLRKEALERARIIVMEMGKPIRQALAEIEKCAWICDYYADNAQSILSEEIVATDASESYVRFDPLGIILAIMPWNFPYWQVFRFAAPALMAGNVCLLKHASNVPLCALDIEKLFIKAGFPENTFTTLLIGAEAVKSVIAHPYIKAATLTGSEFAGKKTAELCGANLKKTVMELGGSDPFIVFEDADIEIAVKTAVTSRIINNGQSCIAAKRFIIVKQIADKFIEKFTTSMQTLKVGDPLDELTEIGPLAKADLVEELYEQTLKTIQNGGKVLCGGNKISGQGFYFEPTVIINVTKGTPAYSEELFGPVASIIIAESEDKAVDIANDSEFGLGASLWTNDIAKAKLYIPKIEAGAVFVNGMVKSDPRLPFGGIKLSGYGRELSSYGIKEFVNIKSVCIA